MFNSGRNYIAANLGYIVYKIKKKFYKTYFKHNIGHIHSPDIAKLVKSDIFKRPLRKYISLLPTAGLLGKLPQF
jgi:hypothetical protein